MRAPRLMPLRAPGAPSVADLSPRQPFKPVQAPQPLPGQPDQLMGPLSSPAARAGHTPLGPPVLAPAASAPHLCAPQGRELTGLPPRGCPQHSPTRQAPGDSDLVTVV